MFPSIPTSSGRAGNPDERVAAQGGRDFPAGMSTRLRIAVVQTVRKLELDDSRDRILAGIADAAASGARVAVFCEGALSGTHSPAALAAAMDAIRHAAHEHGIYVLTGVFGPDARSQRWRNWLRPRYWAGRLRGRRHVNWMLVVGPDGRDVFRYDKIYDRHDAPMPGVFFVDGVPCSAIMCSDRWLRGVEEIPIQQGALVSFELSNNFPSEWVPAFEWYGQVPRAMRNNVWVIYANSAGRPAGQKSTPLTGHGHSAVIAPDGVVAAQAGEEEGVIVADLEITRATRSMAIARAAHPALRAFWSAGDHLHRGERVQAPRLEALQAPTVRFSLAAAPVTGDFAEVSAAIATAGSKGADLVALPAGALDESRLEDVRDAARASRITVVIGVRHQESSGACNSAYVIGADGSLLTRYQQLSAEAPYRAGTSPAAMWFSVKGVPAIVILERDALWTELVELSAIAGARIVVLLEGPAESTAQARQARLQLHADLASYLTLTVTVGAGDASIWDNLLGIEQRRAEFRRSPRPDPGEVTVYSPWSANLIARTSSPTELLVVTRAIPAALNPHYPLRTARFNPQMDAWYRLGAALVRGGK